MPAELLTYVELHQPFPYSWLGASHITSPPAAQVSEQLRQGHTVAVVTEAKEAAEASRLRAQAEAQHLHSRIAQLSAQLKARPCCSGAHLSILHPSLGSYCWQACNGHLSQADTLLPCKARQPTASDRAQRAGAGGRVCTAAQQVQQQRGHRGLLAPGPG